MIRPVPDERSSAAAAALPQGRACYCQKAGDISGAA